MVTLRSMVRLFGSLILISLHSPLKKQRNAGSVVVSFIFCLGLRSPCLKMATMDLNSSGLDSISSSLEGTKRLVLMFLKLPRGMLSSDILVGKNF